MKIWQSRPQCTSATSDHGCICKWLQKPNRFRGAVCDQVLMTDENPEVRKQVIDLLVAHRDDSMVGMLQNLMQREDNSYVRLKCEKALKEMNASIGTF